MTEKQDTGEVLNGLGLTGLDLIEMQIRVERRSQDRKWGEQNHFPTYWLGIIMEELGEVAKACIEQNDQSYRKELIHAAACCVAAMESYDRRAERLQQ